MRDEVGKMTQNKLRNIYIYIYIWHKTTKKNQKNTGPNDHIFAKRQIEAVLASRAQWSSGLRNFFFWSAHRWNAPSTSTRDAIRCISPEEKPKKKKPTWWTAVQVHLEGLCPIFCAAQAWNATQDPPQHLSSTRYRFSDDHFRRKGEFRTIVNCHLLTKYF